MRGEAIGVLRREGGKGRAAGKERDGTRRTSGRICFKASR